MKISLKKNNLTVFCRHRTECITRGINIHQIINFIYFSTQNNLKRKNGHNQFFFLLETPSSVV